MKHNLVFRAIVALVVFWTVGEIIYRLRFDTVVSTAPAPAREDKIRPLPPQRRLSEAKVADRRDTDGAIVYPTGSDGKIILTQGTWQPWVIVGRGEDIYHRRSCPRLNGLISDEFSKNVALSRGYTACRVCDDG
ncbi:MAG: hypothetical protein QM758_05315 [Armatimonas sp.]